MRQSTGTARLSAVPVFVSFDASTPCLSPWKRWLSEAKTERGIKPSQSPAVTALPEGEPRGGTLRLPPISEMAELRHAILEDWRGSLIYFSACVTYNNTISS